MATLSALDQPFLGSLEAFTVENAVLWIRTTILVNIQNTSGYRSIFAGNFTNICKFTNIHLQIHCKVCV